MQSILRRYQNKYLSGLRLQGKVLDLGAKSSENSYHSVISKDKILSVEYCDYFCEGEGIHKVDLEGPLPFASNSYHELLLINVVEHIYNFQDLILECSRIAAPSGRLHLLVPFLWKVHPDPNDYHRYTAQSLEEALSRAGWIVESIEVTVGGRLAVLCAMFDGRLPNFLRTAMQTLCVWLTAADQRGPSEHYPLGYQVRATKA